jgi:hypothetical protein
MHASPALGLSKSRVPPTNATNRTNPVAWPCTDDPAIQSYPLHLPPAPAKQPLQWIISEHPSHQHSSNTNNAPAPPVRR